ncbi:MAG: hypothetical protein GF363_06885 [Chitinivibrionales bacterium]|nr:hypothetical protein [Chitinivibrionales bacterium]
MGWPETEREWLCREARSRHIRCDMAMQREKGTGIRSQSKPATIYEMASKHQGVDNDRIGEFDMENERHWFEMDRNVRLEMCTDRQSVSQCAEKRLRRVFNGSKNGHSGKCGGKVNIEDYQGEGNQEINRR